MPPAAYKLKPRFRPGAKQRKRNFPGGRLLRKSRLIKKRWKAVREWLDTLGSNKDLPTVEWKSL